MTSGVFANEIAEDNLAIKRCCIRTSSDDNGNSWSARRCVEHADSAQAYGAACALAQEDADNSKKNASVAAIINGAE
jgi:hypothetical protein